jgi:predicted ArsR family transcriptional regulator
MVVNGEEFLTVKEMAEKLGITPNTAKHRLFQLGIKPVSTDAIYDKAAMEAIRNVPGKGRPRKPKPE